MWRKLTRHSAKSQVRHLPVDVNDERCGQQPHVAGHGEPWQTVREMDVVVAKVLDSDITVEELKKNGTM